MKTFELMTDPRGNWVRMFINGQEYAVPCDENNADYQAYLKSLENANQLQRIPGL